MSSESKAALVSICLLLVATSNPWTSPSTGLQKTESRRPSSSLAKLRKFFRRIPPSKQTAGGIAGEEPGHLKQTQPGKRRGGWRPVLKRRRPKSTEDQPYDESKLRRLPYFLRSGRTFKEKLLKLFDRFYQPVIHKEVIADLYRRHAEDEKNYVTDDNDDT